MTRKTPQPPRIMGWFQEPILSRNRSASHNETVGALETSRRDLSAAQTHRSVTALSPLSRKSSLFFFRGRGGGVPSRVSRVRVWIGVFSRTVNEESQRIDSIGQVTLFDNALCSLGKLKEGWIRIPPPTLCDTQQQSATGDRS